MTIILLSHFFSEATLAASALCVMPASDKAGVPAGSYVIGRPAPRQPGSEPLITRSGPGQLWTAGMILDGPAEERPYAL